MSLSIEMTRGDKPINERQVKDLNKMIDKVTTGIQSIKYESTRGRVLSKNRYKVIRNLLSQLFVETV
jgi:hypothetical protein